MQRRFWLGMIVSLVLSCGGTLLANEADELRERAHAMRKEAAVLAERGQLEQAERLEREAGELLKASERMEWKTKGRAETDEHPGIDQEVLRLKARLQDLQAEERNLRKVRASEQEMAEVRSRIAGIQRELQTIHAQPAGLGKRSPESRAAFEELRSEKIAAASRRIHHLRVAAENLQLADAHDLARQIMEKAEVIEREVQAERKRLAAEVDEAHRRDAGPEIIRALKHEVERLRAEINELRHKLEGR